jgi:tRNA A37 methylthiotransferase MiaB
VKIGFVSLGCPKNLVDSEVMIGLVQEAGHDVTADAAAADVLVVNTCAFIDRAKQESIDTILELAQHKTNGRCRKLVVTGCLANVPGRAAGSNRRIDAVLGRPVPTSFAVTSPAHRRGRRRRCACSGSPDAPSACPAASLPGYPTTPTRHAPW